MILCLQLELFCESGIRTHDVGILETGGGIWKTGKYFTNEFYKSEWLLYFTKRCSHI